MTDEEKANKEAYFKVLAIFDRDEDKDLYGRSMGLTKVDIEDQELLYLAVGHSPKILPRVMFASEKVRRLHRFLWVL